LARLNRFHPETQRQGKEEGEEVPIFELKGVTQEFNSCTALTDINLRIYPGERVALVGSSGAGKSTLISLLNGTLWPTVGEVWVLGANLASVSPGKLRQIQAQMGTIYQQFNLIDNLAVIHNVNAGHLARWPFWQAAVSLLFPLEVETARIALSRVGIEEKLYAKTNLLSGGQQQRVALARVLVQNPLAILADEPIASLDPELSREIMDLLREMSVKEGKTLVVSLHDLELALLKCDRLIGLREGRIIFDAACEDISQRAMDDLYK